MNIKKELFSNSNTKVVSIEVLSYFAKQFYAKLNTTFANIVHRHKAADTTLQDGRNLEVVIAYLESNSGGGTGGGSGEVILTSPTGKIFTVSVDDSGRVVTTEKI